MLDLLILLIPAVPFAGSLVLAMTGRRLSRKAAALIGAGSVGVAAALTLLTATVFFSSRPDGAVLTRTAGSWIDTEGIAVAFGLTLDPLSLLMSFVITGVGFLIHLYSTEFMRGDDGYSRFFSLMNLFIAAMLILVLADNLVLLYLGWEGVGLCSFLLIGFWHQDPVTVRAARKAFLVTRIGDTAMIIGLFVLFDQFGTLNIAGILNAARAHWQPGSPAAVAAAALLLGGAVGKSAQLPLQVWLPDAMAGPSPVSALIHAATMVTAGVYLIARTHVLFELAPLVQSAVAVIGAATLLTAGCSALAQGDIKRVLAYSTVSQIGYMFLALGVGAYSAAMFHFMTHAFFKALLFLSAGAVILAQHHEHDMFRMGGLKDRLPAVFWAFLAGAASLSALPLITAGFYSKDLIIWSAWSSPSGGPWLAGAALAGALITSAYAFRMVFLTFFGEARMDISFRPGGRMLAPLGILAALSVAGGFVEIPHSLGGRPLFSEMLFPVLSAPDLSQGGAVEALALQVLGATACLAGIGIAYILYRRNAALRERLVALPGIRPLVSFWAAGWGFDGLYSTLIARPFSLLARVLASDIPDAFFTGIARLAISMHSLLSATQTGNIRWYAGAIVLGAIFIAGVLLLS